MTGKRSSIPPPAAAPAPAPRAEGWFLAHDGPMVLGALIVLVASFFVHRTLTAPKLARFERAGLTFDYPAGWFPKDPEPEAFPVDVGFDSTDHPEVKLLVRITKKPPVDGPIDSIVSLRSAKYGELYKELASGPERVAGRDWVRSVFTYAYKLDGNDTPRLAFAVEYAAVNNDNLYVVTLVGPEAEVRRLEGSILASVALR